MPSQQRRETCFFEVFSLNPQAEHLLPNPLCLPQKFTSLLLAKFILQYNCLFICFSSLRSYEFLKHKLWHFQLSTLSTQQRLAPYKMISKHIKNYFLTSDLELSLLFCPVSYCYFYFPVCKNVMSIVKFSSFYFRWNRQLSKKFKNRTPPTGF